MMKHLKNWICPNLVMVIGSACLLILYWMHRSFQMCAILNVELLLLFDDLIERDVFP